MPRSIWFLFAGILLACAILLGLRACDDSAGGDAGAAASRRGTGPMPAGQADAAQASSPDPASAAREAAMREAVSTLHEYIGALPGDRARADGYWAGGKPPGDSGEADLRDLRSPRGIRLQNWTPTFLGATDDALEVPVAVRVSLADTSIRHYRGWYRLRRAITGDRWEITSASIDLERRPQ